MADVINFAMKYSGELAEKFAMASFVKKNTLGKLDFEGAKTVRVPMLNTVAPRPYKRSGASRYGEAKDITDTLLEYTMQQDLAYNGVVDNGDELDQTITSKAAQWLSAEYDEQIAPMIDKYSLERIARFGHCVGTAAPDKTSIVTMIADADVHFTNKLVPAEGRILYVPATYCKEIYLSDEFLQIEKLGEQAISKGEIGSLFNFKIIRIPDGYLPTGCYFLAHSKNAVAMPQKISTSRVHKNPVGVDGSVVEGRDYFDCFVLGNKADAVYSAVATASKLATPTITITDGTATIAATGATSVQYTLDGSDPRFSAKAKEYPAGGVTMETGDTIRVVAFGVAPNVQENADGDGILIRADKFTSDMAEATYTAS